MASSTTQTTGVSGTFLLGILFVGLKLTGYIGWSWWWVTCPFWGPVAIFLIVFVGVVIFAAAKG